MKTPFRKRVCCGTDLNNSIAEKTKKCNKMEKSHLHLPDEWYKIQKSEMASSGRHF